MSLRIGLYNEIDDAIVEMRGRGKNNGEIADALGIAANTVGDRVKVLIAAGRITSRAGKRPGPDKSKRPCMMCRVPFPSSGTGHTHCDRCKRTDAWRDGIASTTLSGVSIRG